MSVETPNTVDVLATNDYNSGAVMTATVAVPVFFVGIIGGMGIIVVAMALWKK